MSDLEADFLAADLEQERLSYALKYTRWMVLIATLALLSVLIITALLLGKLSDGEIRYSTLYSTLASTLPSIAAAAFPITGLLAKLVVTGIKHIQLLRLQTVSLHLTYEAARREAEHTQSAISRASIKAESLS
jgi:hypothetical protein